MSSYLASNTSHHGGLWHRGTWSQRKNQCKITWDREVNFKPDKYTYLELSCCKEDASAGNRLRWKPDKQVGPQTVVHVVPTRRCTYLSYDSSTLATGGGSRALVALARRADLSHFSFYNKTCLTKLFVEVWLQFLSLYQCPESEGRWQSSAERERERGEGGVTWQSI